MAFMFTIISAPLFLPHLHQLLHVHSSMVQCNNHGPRVVVYQTLGSGAIGVRQARERSIESKELGGRLGGEG